VRGEDAGSSVEGGHAVESIEAGWVAVCEEAALGTTPKAAHVDGRSLVVWRTVTGRVVALDDRCPHQGNALSGGAVVGEEIRCPAHGWQVGSDGWCDRAGAGVASHAVVERDGTIFVRLARRR